MNSFTELPCGEAVGGCFAQHIHDPMHSIQMGAPLSSRRRPPSPPPAPPCCVPRVSRPPLRVLRRPAGSPPGTQRRPDPFVEAKFKSIFVTTAEARCGPLHARTACPPRPICSRAQWSSAAERSPFSVRQGDRAWLEMERKADLVAAAVRGAPRSIGLRDSDLRVRSVVVVLHAPPRGLWDRRIDAPAFRSSALPRRPLNAPSAAHCFRACSTVLTISANKAACGKETKLDLGIFGTMYAYLLDACDIVVGRPYNTDESLAEFDVLWERYATYAMECAAGSIVAPCSLLFCRSMMVCADPSADWSTTHGPRPCLRARSLLGTGVMDVIKGWLMRRMSHLWREIGDPRMAACIQGEGDNRGFHLALNSTSRGPRGVRPQHAPAILSRHALRECCFGSEGRLPCP